MASNVSQQERFDTALITWVAISYHPSMPKELRISSQNSEVVFRRVGKLLDHLSAEVCVDKARATACNEGSSGLTDALYDFWTIENMELNQSKETKSAFAEMWSYLDRKKISAAIKAK